MPGDCDSGLPIRTEADGIDQRVHIKIYDGTTSPSANAAEVDDDNNLHILNHGHKPNGDDVVARHSELGHYAIDGIYHATNNTDPSNIGLVIHVRGATPGDSDQTFRPTGGTPTLDGVDPANVHAQDVTSFPMVWDDGDGEWDRWDGNVTINNPDDFDIDGVYHAVNNADPDNIGLIGHVRNATPDDTHQTNRLTSVQNDTVVALDVSLHDEAGAAYTEDNPLPVTNVGIGDAAPQLHDFRRTDDVARHGTADHIYTVPANKILHLMKWKIVSSGKIKGELYIETGVGTDVYDLVDADFNSTSSPSQRTKFPKEFEVAAGVRVKITLTNRDWCTFDVFSFINGYLEDA